VLAGRDGVAVRAIRCRNVAEDKPRKYLMDGDDLRRALASMDDAGEADAEGNPGEPLAIYHSHVQSPARPSETDIADAARWPYSFYVLVSLTHEPQVAAWRIEGGEVRPATIAG
jgi:proteasome lid subunit RPN8/RPN11